jgi:fructose-1,6-bisphosphatase/inositol monophosphatase family enzyme
MPLTEDQAAAIVDATRAVAAAEIVPRFRNLDAGEVDAKSAFDDLVTIADTAAETALTARLLDVLPGDAVIGEEAVAADPALLDRVGEGRVTIIDPIDGTWNFAHGNANYGVIVAVVEGDETVWGLLYDPSFDDWIEAHRGGGAWFHRGGARRRLILPDGPAEAPERMRGTLHQALFPGAVRPALAAVAPRFRRTSGRGASLHEYRALATGASAFCLNAALKVWDHAAGVLILEEAGGASRLIDGTPYRPTLREGTLLSARNDATWDAVAGIVRAPLRS